MLLKQKTKGFNSCLCLVSYLIPRKVQMFEVIALLYGLEKQGRALWFYVISRNIKRNKYLSLLNKYQHSRVDPLISTLHLPENT